MAFDWRQHITISDRFSPQERERIAQSLDQIANTRDEDGPELLRKALERNGGRLQINPTERGAPDGSNANKPGIVELDIDQISRLGTPSSGFANRASLTGVLVHELYHKADPQFLAFRNAAPGSRFARYLEILEPDPTKRASLAARYASAGNVTEIINLNLEIVAAYGAENVTNAQSQSGMLVDGALAHETSATQYTTAFMNKHFRGEAGRANYSGFEVRPLTFGEMVAGAFGFRNPVADIPVVAPLQPGRDPVFGCHRDEAPGFTERPLNGAQAPTVRPTLPQMELPNGECAIMSNRPVPTEADLGHIPTPATPAARPARPTRDAVRAQ